MDRLIALMVMLLLVTAPAEAVPQRTIAPSEADAHIAQRTDPAVPSLAKTLKVGGKVKLHIVISPTGDVSSAKVLSGHPMLVTSAIEAVKRWKYKPFTEGDTPIAVATDVEVEFPAGMSKDEAAVRNRFFPIEDECRTLLNTRKYADAEHRCQEAVATSNDLPKDAVLERSSARALLANSIYLQRRAAEAIPLYEEALELDKGYLKANDADLATDYANLARACTALGDISKADSLYVVAVSTYEAAILNLPGMKENYTRRLKRTLLEHAQVKDAQGQVQAADALRKRAATLP